LVEIAHILTFCQKSLEIKVEEGVKTREFLINGKFYDSLFMGLGIDL
jgi:hypothetical protein